MMNVDNKFVYIWIWVCVCLWTRNYKTIRYLNANSRSNKKSIVAVWQRQSEQYRHKKSINLLPIGATLAWAFSRPKFNAHNQITYFSATMTKAHERKKNMRKNMQTSQIHPCTFVCLCHGWFSFIHWLRFNILLCGPPPLIWHRGALRIQSTPSKSPTSKYVALLSENKSACHSFILSVLTQCALESLDTKLCRKTVRDN